ncbi:helix-turn-helix domain-containing protein [Paenibacillus chitinolyticus]|uniref:helix-turn-helix domain-containing protein n=1 Tax=Paenibacillus chitinolyticus TaxID=79263 RepID=UPI0036D86FE0
MSQKEVSEFLDISQTFYSKIENGQARLSLEVAKKLKSLYSVGSIEDLLDDVS